MAALFREAEPHISDDPGSRANYRMLQEQLDRSVQYAAPSRSHMLKSDLKDAFAICTSCHQQDKQFVRSYGISRFRKMDEFLAGEYSYMTRDYQSAMTSYKNFLASGSKDNVRNQTALDHLLVITLEIHADPELARNTFEAVRSDLMDRHESTVEVEEWISAIAKLSYEPGDMQSPITRRDIVTMDWYLRQQWPLIQSTLTWNQQLVYWIAIRGQLNAMLNDGPSSRETPMVLYWLAASDRALHYRFYDSLSRRYLVQCIRDFSNHEYARECFKEYEMMMIVTFSGSRGVYLPPEARREIEELRRLVYGPTLER